MCYGNGTDKVQWAFRGKVFWGELWNHLSRGTRVHKGTGEVFQAVFSHSI